MALAGFSGVLGPATVAAPATPAPVGAGTVASCSAGVIVAADFSHWGGDINSVCDAALPENAAVALQDAKFDPTGVAGVGLAFICQIAGFPPHDPCTSTPPADAYWSFWYALAGQNTWTYSQSGAMNLAPSAGSVEAWVFGGNTGASPPSAFPSPNSIRAATVRVVQTTPTTTSPTSQPTQPSVPASTRPATGTTSPAPGAGPTDGGQATHAGGPAGGSPSDPTTDHPSDPSTTTAATGTTKPAAGRAHPSAGAVRATARGTTTPRIVNAAPAVAVPPPPNSPLPFVIGGFAVAVLAAAGSVVAWRRRRAD